MYPNIEDRNELWKVIPEMRYSMCYLDIETNGLDINSSIITCATVYDGKDYLYYSAADEVGTRFFNKNAISIPPLFKESLHTFPPFLKKTYILLPLFLKGVRGI